MIHLREVTRAALNRNAAADYSLDALIAEYGVLPGDLDTPRISVRIRAERE